MSNVNKINDTDLEGLGVTALPDVPAMSTTDLKRKFEEIMRDVVIPKVNEAIDQLNELDERTESLDPDALISAVSQGVSENLIENGTFIAEESDPTVPEWAKSSSKPVYTAAEVGADPAGAADSKAAAPVLVTTAQSGTLTPTDNTVYAFTASDAVTISATADTCPLYGAELIVSVGTGGSLAISAVSVTGDDVTAAAEGDVWEISVLRGRAIAIRLSGGVSA